MEPKSFPVKYMVTAEETIFWPHYVIRDTSLEGNGRFVATGVNLATAHRICKFLNDSEGFVYENA